MVNSGVVAAIHVAGVRCDSCGAKINLYTNLTLPINVLQCCNSKQSIL